MKDIKTMTEVELRKSEVPRLKTEEELMEYITNLTNRQHDYGTCVYAMSMSAVAAYNFVASKLGVTGFQASCADMDILRRNRNMESGFMILDYKNLLYPQYCTDEHFPGWQKLIEMNSKQLAKRAREELDKNKGDVHPDVKKHWEMLADLETKG